MFAGTESGVWRLWYPEASTKVDDSNNAPAQWTLEQNYPNPFNSSTKIQFSIPSAGRVSLKVYTMLGSVVMDLVDKTMSPGTYRIEFSPATLPSGIYFYTLATNEFRMTKKLILMK
jgi:hypothetical protein